MVCVVVVVGVGRRTTRGDARESVSMGDVVDDGAFIVLGNHVLCGRIEGRRGRRVVYTERREIWTGERGKDTKWLER